MKKSIIIALAAVLVLLIALSVFLLVRFTDLAQGEEDPSMPQAREMEAYAAEHWPQYAAEFDEGSQYLTLSKKTTLSYEEARKVGAAVYSGNTAPETYLDAAAAIALALRTEFGGSVQTRLSFLSTDGEVIFSVTSRGDVVTCWEAAE